MVRSTLSVIAGLVVWVLVVTAAGFVLRGAWPAYASVADAMTFTLPMMFVRQAIGFVATLAMGWTTAVVSRRSPIAPLVSGVLLLLAFIPQHISLWDKFPIWYHLMFLLSIVPLSFAGSKLARPLTVPATPYRPLRQS